MVFFKIKSINQNIGENTKHQINKFYWKLSD